MAKQKIHVIGGERKGQILRAMIGKDGAFVEFMGVYGPIVETIPNDQFEIIKTGKEVIPEAFDSGDQIHIPTKKDVIMEKTNKADVAGLIGALWTPAVEGYLEEWPMDGPVYVENVVDDVDNLQKEKAMLEQALAEITRDRDGLEQLNKDIQAKNTALTDKLNETEKALLEINEFNKKLKNDLYEMTELNDHHRAEVEKGNEYREGIKRTVEELHAHVREARETARRESSRANEAEEELNRYKRIVDALTKRSF